MHRSTRTWKEFSCRLLPTLGSSSAPAKVLAALWAYIRAPLALMRCDIAHFHIAAGSSVLRKTPIVWLASLLARKIVLHFHCAGPESLFDATPQPLLSFLRSRADLVIVLSPWWKKEFERRWPNVCVAVLPNPIAPVAASREKSAAAAPEILFVGVLSKRKGYDLLLAAMADVIHEYPAARLSLAGDGEVAIARSAARRLGIAHNVRICGWIAGDELQDMYRQAQILCLPSYAEGVPLAVLDAMAHGLAVITTPVGGIPDLVVDGENGLLVPAGNQTAVVHAIVRLLRDPEERARIGEAGRQTVSEAHSVARVSHLLREIYCGMYTRSAVVSEPEPASHIHPA